MLRCSRPRMTRWNNYEVLSVGTARGAMEMFWFLECSLIVCCSSVGPFSL
jgi:hypothetical protein